MNTNHRRGQILGAETKTTNRLRDFWTLACFSSDRSFCFFSYIMILSTQKSENPASDARSASAQLRSAASVSLLLAKKNLKNTPIMLCSCRNRDIPLTLSLVLFN